MSTKLKGLLTQVAPRICSLILFYDIAKFSISSMALLTSERGNLFGTGTNWGSLVINAKSVVGAS